LIFKSNCPKCSYLWGIVFLSSSFCCLHRREYVAKVLTANIPELTQADAYVIMQKAHKSGMAVVGVWMFELAEAYCERLRAGGLISSVAEED